MSTIIIQTTLLAEITGLFVLNETFILLGGLLIIFAFIFIVNFGFDIEERVSSVATAFATVAVAL